MRVLPSVHIFLPHTNTANYSHASPINFYYSHATLIIFYYSHATPLIYYYSHATPLLKAIQRNLLGSFRALLGRNCNAGDAGDAGAGDPRTGGGCAFALALALALGCSTKGANSLSNSELDSLLDMSPPQLRALSALPFCAGCATQRLLLWPNSRQLVHLLCFRFKAHFRTRFSFGHLLFFAINGCNINRSERMFSINNRGIATLYIC
jgi:hypothetical protein